MHIIIVGDGKVGYTLARHLSKEENDVVIIDKDINVLKKASDLLDVMCIKGNGLSAEVLSEAGVENADIVISVTSRDEVNMLCCLTAKKLGAKYSVARIRDPEYTQELFVIKNKLDLDMVINPEQATAVEITKLLEFPAATNVDTFAYGKVEMVGIRLNEDDCIVDLKIAKIATKIPANVLFCAIERNGDIFIPNGDFIMKCDDIAYIIGQPLDIIQFFKYLNRHTQKIKTAMIIGGGRISMYLAQLTSKMKIKVKLIEIDERKCLELNESLPNCLIIYGDGTDENLLLSENISGMGAVISLMDSDAENLLTSVFSVHKGVPRVIAKINRTGYRGIMKTLGVESIVSPRDIVAEQIIRYVRSLKKTIGSDFKAMYKIIDDKAEALEFTANSTTKFLNIPLNALNIKKGILVASIIRNDKVIIPKGNDYIENGDGVIIIAKNSSFSDLNDIL